MRAAAAAEQEARAAAAAALAAQQAAWRRAEATIEAARQRVLDCGKLRG